MTDDCSPKGIEACWGRSECRFRQYGSEERIPAQKCYFPAQPCIISEPDDWKALHRFLESMNLHQAL